MSRLFRLLLLALVAGTFEREDNLYRFQEVVGDILCFLQFLYFAVYIANALSSQHAKEYQQYCQYY